MHITDKHIMAGAVILIAALFFAMGYSDNKAMQHCQAKGVSEANCYYMLNH